MKPALILIVFLLFPNDIYGNNSGMALIPAGEFSIGASTQVIHLESFYIDKTEVCLLYTSPSPRDRQKSRMPSSA